MFNSYNFLQQENDPQNYYFYRDGFSKKELKNVHVILAMMNKIK